MKDILLHVLGALAMLAAATGLGWLLGHPVAGAWIGAVLSFAFWTGREAAQAWKKYGGRVWPWSGEGWSATKVIEALAPTVAGVLAAAVVTALL